MEVINGFTIHYHTVKYVSLNKDTTSVIVPSKTGYGLVTELEGRCLDGKHLISVILPEKLEAIYSYSLSNNRLKSITIPPSVTKIYGLAFKSNRIEMVIIPKGVTFLGRGIFEDNPLTAIACPSKYCRTDEQVRYTFGIGLDRFNRMNREKVDEFYAGFGLDMFNLPAIIQKMFSRMVVGLLNPDQAGYGPKYGTMVRVINYFMSRRVE